MSGRGRTPPQWLPTPRWTIALTGWRETFSFNAGLAGNASDSSGDKLHELHRRRVAVAERHWHLHILVANVHFTADVLGRGTFLLSMECVPTAGSVGKRCVVCE